MTSITIDRKNQPRSLGPAEASPLQALLSSAARLLRFTAKAPVKPAPRDVVREAAEVRALAHSYRKTDPGFAADLYAAADRHELAGDGAT
jgi:hypothetical protein